MLVSASRRNELFHGTTAPGTREIINKVRDREDAIASTRDACAPQTYAHRKIESAGYATPFFITVSISEACAMSSNGFELRITRSAK